MNTRLYLIQDSEHEKFLGFIIGNPELAELEVFTSNAEAIPITFSDASDVLKLLVEVCKSEPIIIFHMSESKNDMIIISLNKHEGSTELTPITLLELFTITDAIHRVLKSVKHQSKVDPINN